MDHTFHSMPLTQLQKITLYFTTFQHTQPISHNLWMCLFTNQQKSFQWYNRLYHTCKVTPNEKVLISETNFHVVSGEACKKTMTITPIKFGFWVCGICLFNPSTIIKDCLMPYDQLKIKRTRRK